MYNRNLSLNRHCELVFQHVFVGCIRCQILSGVGSVMIEKVSVQVVRLCAKLVNGRGINARS